MFRFLFRKLACAALVCAVFLPAIFTATSNPAKAEEVYLIRGLWNVHSQGVDKMAARLRAQGIKAKAISNGFWAPISTDIIRRAKLGKVSYPIAIVGYSMGGVEAVEFANRLSRANIPVALVVGVDAGAPVPSRLAANVRAGKSYFARVGHNFRAGPGFSGTIVNLDLKPQKLRHRTIVNDATVQNQIIHDVAQAVR